MDEKLIPFPKRPKAPQLHYKGLMKLFKKPELRRELEPVRDEETSLHPNVEGMGMEWYTSRYSGPGDGYQEIGLFRLRDLGVRPELLVYRVLRALYGTPDIITVAFPPEVVHGDRDLKDGEHPLPWEWSFMLKGNSDAYIEVRKQPGSQEPHLALWAPKLHEANQVMGERIQTDLRQFLAELKKTMERSLHLVEAKSVQAQSTALGPSNVYADMLAAGDEHLEAASLLSDRYEEARSVRGPTSGVAPSIGTFYLGAATAYLLALEGFVNLLSVILRKEDFRADVFDRATTRADFELRLLTLPLYCDGFATAPITPEASTFKNLKRLRDFRNNLLHANLSPDDHVIRIVPEDHFMFFWWSAVDDVKVQPFERLPLARVLFRKSHAQNVREAVEETVDVIVDSLQPDYKRWVLGWRKKQLIPAILKNSHWSPNFKGVPVASIK